MLLLPYNPVVAALLEGPNPQAALLEELKLRADHVEIEPGIFHHPCPSATPMFQLAKAQGRFKNLEAWLNDGSSNEPGAANANG